MAETKESLHVTSYELIIWQYDTAPDAEVSCYVWKRGVTDDMRGAKQAAVEHVERGAVGAGVFLNGVLVYGRGLTMEYPDR